MRRRERIVLFGVLRFIKCHKNWGAEAHVPGDDVDLFLAVSRTMEQSLSRKTKCAARGNTRTFSARLASCLRLRNCVGTALPKAIYASSAQTTSASEASSVTWYHVQDSTSASPADPRTERVSHNDLAARLERPARPARDAAPSESIFRAETLQRY